MKIKILNNISYQTFPIVKDMIEVDDTILARIGIDKQFDKYGNIIAYTPPIENAHILSELEDWFDNYFDKQIKQSLWQEDFTISHDNYFDKDYANLDELKVQANKVRIQIKLLRQEVKRNGKQL